MRLMLVDNLVFPAERDLQLLDVHPHLGLLAVASVACAEGHEVSIYDPKRELRQGNLPYCEDLYERVADALLGWHPDAIGFTTLGCSFLFALRVGRALRRRQPAMPIILGGPHATMLARPILERYDSFDVVVRHEAEHTIGPVLSRLDSREFSDIPGVTWRTPRGIAESAGSPRVDDLDSLPWLDYDLYPMSDLGLELLRVEAGRGCPFACTFCSTASFFQRRYRLKSPARIVAEMDHLHDRYHPREFKLDHDLFTVNRHKVAAFCEVVRDRGYRWRVSARADCVDTKLLDQMAEAGCVGLYLGIETGSARMQQVAGKRLDLQLVTPTLDTCERLGIETTASFITGYPEETDEDQRATLDMLAECFSRPAASCIPQLHILTPEPGTPLFDSRGGQLAFDGYATPFNARLLGPQDRHEVLAAPDIFASYHYYPAALDRPRHVAVVEAVDLLRKFSRPLLTALIGEHDGSLADFVLSLIGFAETTPRQQDLENYLRHRLGDEHPLTSAVRYEIFADRSRANCSFDGADGVAPDPDATYAVPFEAEILADVHTYHEVERWLVTGQAPTAFSCSSYVWLEHRGVMVQIEPSAAHLLELFGSGRCAARVADVLGFAKTDPTFQAAVSDLIGAGLLVSTPEVISA